MGVSRWPQCRGCASPHTSLLSLTIPAALSCEVCHVVESSPGRITRFYAGPPPTGDWRQAAAQLRCSVAAIRAQYGEESVELGRQLYKLAQLHFNG